MKHPKNHEDNPPAGGMNQGQSNSNQTDDKSAEIDILKDQLLRAKAELDNLHKRSQTEKENFIKFAQADLIGSLLPVLDNFKRAAAHAPQTDDSTMKNWIIGVQAVERQLEEILKQFGVIEIETVPGHAFDPALHEAISHEPSDQPENSIISVTEIGYLLNDKVLRPAKVKVSSGSN